LVNFNLFLVILLLTIILLSSSGSIKYLNYANAQESNDIQGEQPIINDPNLKTEVVVNGLELPTGMAFLGPDDILVTEKDKGTVRRVIDGKILPEPLLDVNVANKSERGMLGIAVSKHENGPTYVFLYYTEAKVEGSDICPVKGKPCIGDIPLGNRLYRYELVDNKLVNPKLLLDLPTQPGPSHDGGVVRIGPDDNNVYVVVGDLNYIKNQNAYTIAQNVVDGRPADGRGGVLRITQDGGVVGGEGRDDKGILGNEDPLNKYYAYGIRNSFGINFDPVTGKLWETENGGVADEINLVEPGFNSGWKQLMGKASDYKDEGFNPDADLVDFGGRGKYSDPKFQWTSGGGNGSMRMNPAPTAITFLNSDKLGKQYENDMFVGSVKQGRIFNFDLNDDRTELDLNSPLDDKVADSADESEDVTFAHGLDIVTDLEVGPDGYLYVVSLGQGTIYRIVHGGDNIDGTNEEVSTDEDEDDED
jgi:glucose/arabinose dehydrogenase